MVNKRKIINDPVFGFLTIPNELLYDVLQHPYVQRLGRIRQLGLSNFVYPGAMHTRFLHSIGAMHLMQEGLQSLRQKGVVISDKEATGAMAAILLHDIGHGPFSHVLEHTLETDWFDGSRYHRSFGRRVDTKFISMDSEFASRRLCNQR